MDQTHHQQRQGRQQIGSGKAQLGRGEIPRERRQNRRQAQRRRRIQRTITSALGGTLGGDIGSSGRPLLKPIGGLVGRVTRPPTRLGPGAALALTALFTARTLAITNAGIWMEHLPTDAASFLGEHAPGYVETSSDGSA
jgi:hypothetical protein